MVKASSTIEEIDKSVAKQNRHIKIIIGSLLGLFVLVYLWRSIFIPIHSGEIGVVWSRFSGGTMMNQIFDEGYRVIFPWDRMAIYEIRIQTMKEDVNALTMDGLDVTVTVNARFRPMAAELPLLHKYVGPRYKDSVVWPTVLASLRHVIRRYKPEEIRVIGEETLSSEVNEAVKVAIAPYWIDFDQVLITRIRIPEVVENAIQDKLAEEQRLLKYSYIIKQAEMEKQRRAIEGEGLAAFESRAHVSVLQWRGLEVTEKLAASPNSKLVIMGAGQNQLPILLNEGK